MITTYSIVKLLKLYEMTLGKVGLSWVMPKMIVELFANVRGLCDSLQIAEEWKMDPIYLVWCIWREGMIIMKIVSG